MTEFGLLTFKSTTGNRAGVAVGDALFDAAELTREKNYSTTLDILQDWPNAEACILAALRAAPSALMKASDAELLAPIPKPAAIYCAGANYQDHTVAMFKKLDLPPPPDPHELGTDPWHFLKSGHTVVGPGATVRSRSSALDWEAELAVVIGRTASDVTVDDALSYVAGYTIANDLSARDKSRREKIEKGTPFAYDWIAHKNFNGSCPLGPMIVPARQIIDPQSLSIKLWVNGVLRQDGNSGSMIFTAAEQIAHLSSIITLHPGDVILTGTPAGTGAESDTFLAPGDDIRIVIDGLGELETHIT